MQPATPTCGCGTHTHRVLKQGWLLVNRKGAAAVSCTKLLARAATHKEACVRWKSGASVGVSPNWWLLCFCCFNKTSAATGATQFCEWLGASNERLMEIRISQKSSDLIRQPSGIGEELMKISMPDFVSHESNFLFLIARCFWQIRLTFNLFCRGLPPSQNY